MPNDLWPNPFRGIKIGPGFWLFLLGCVAIGYLLTLVCGCSEEPDVPKPPKSPVIEDYLVTWSSNTEEDLAGYVVYWGEAPGIYNHNADAWLDTSYTITWNRCKNIYVAVTAYDTAGNESDFSKEVFEEGIDCLEDTVRLNPEDFTLTNYRVATNSKGFTMLELTNLQGTAHVGIEKEYDHAIIEVLADADGADTIEIYSGGQLQGKLTTTERDDQWYVHEFGGIFKGDLMIVGKGKPENSHYARIQYVKLIK